MGTTINATAASLLGFLHDAPLTGYALSQVAEEALGNFWSITRSQVYRELSRMADVGLVRPSGEPGPRDRQPYELTDAGRQAFAAWAADTPNAETIRFPLLLVLSLGRHVDDDVLGDHLRTHRAEHARRLAEYDSIWEQLPDDVTAEGVDRWRVATLAFGRRYEQAVLGWFDELPDLLGIQPTNNAESTL